ncbi:MAG TPA: DUF72 domain-containing protein [Ignavibacteriaceae bacterium]|nr:DUF72 domain-containing protein [Ignavibacteriaceae bacterium]
MNLYVGTSGYSYKEWKGNFYPSDLSEKKMLKYYAEHFNTVEINNTFYRMPKADVLKSWKNDVPVDFKFIIKSPKRITHSKNIESNDPINYLINTVQVLDNNLGPILFQFPPYFKKYMDRLQPFVETIPDNIKAAFEFRHQSWFDDEVYAFLREHNFALCLSDTEENPINDIIPTADWIYLRLRRLEYNDKSLKAIQKKIIEHNWKDAYIFFKHEDEGKGPAFANKFLNVFQKSNLREKV